MPLLIRNAGLVMVLGLLNACAPYPVHSDRYPVYSAPRPRAIIERRYYQPSPPPIIVEQRYYGHRRHHHEYGREHEHRHGHGREHDD